MCAAIRGVLIGLFVTALLLALAAGFPTKENLKIRIHVPVKHHTHVHTKTIIKKVPVPIPVHVKEHHHDHHEHHEYKSKYHVEEDGEDDFESYDAPKKTKRRTRHPFV